ncbi:hypothetical protein QOZ80_7BG0584990 [Eleusine coracana subsp. coracana]|nr:hypothetical protein QOZ80_7BG0584990 [Eleusine coracana subsp. coracana]
MPRRPPPLIDDVVGEILLRVPPDEPAHLVRAALVCKPWRRILFDPAFRRRYRAFHRTPPLLGFLRFEMVHPDLKFVSTAAASPFPAQAHPNFSTPAHPNFSTPAHSRRQWRTLDCRHGRVLLYSFRTRRPGRLLLWDPITGGKQRFPMPDDPSPEIFSAAVLCTADSCNHLDCHGGGPFRVVFAGTDQDYVTWVTEFSSETRAWSALTKVDFRIIASNRVGLAPAFDSFVSLRPSLFTGDAVYFILEKEKAILKYDLDGRGVSVIDTPRVYRKRIILMTAEDGELGFAGLKDCDLHLWSWKPNAKGIPGWMQLRVIKLKSLLSVSESCYSSPQVKKVGRRFNYEAVVPYMSFYAPDLVGVRPSPP